MADGKWSPGKIVLLVIGILVGLGVLCCGAGYLMFGDKIKATFALTSDMKNFKNRLQADLGEETSFGLEKNDKNDMVLTIGIEGELTPPRVTETQDKAWRAVSETFAENGFFPVRWVAVGHRVAEHREDEEGQSGTVVDWSQNMASVDDLVKRTGVAAPPLSKLLPADFDVKIHGGKARVRVEESKGDKSGGK